MDGGASSATVGISGHGPEGSGLVVALARCKYTRRVSLEVNRARSRALVGVVNVWADVIDRVSERCLIVSLRLYCAVEGTIVLPLTNVVDSIQGKGFPVVDACLLIQDRRR